MAQQAGGAVAGGRTPDPCRLLALSLLGLQRQEATAATQFPPSSWRQLRPFLPPSDPHQLSKIQFGKGQLPWPGDVEEGGAGQSRGR